MKKYFICSFCLFVILCGAYIYNYDKISNGPIFDREEKIISVDAANNTVKSDAILITEICKINQNNENEIRRTQSVMPSIYLGMTRSEVDEQLKKYMDNRSINDLENGLIQFDLIYFSTNCLILRKTYEIEEDFHKYFIKFNKGCITVFYSDRKTVYEYTDIALTSLPPNIAANIITGMEIKDEKELFDFLENYSS